jgi:peptidoglycan/xylan/chitin deacetylase (PgdA/CDA1 family)
MGAVKRRLKISLFRLGAGSPVRDLRRKRLSRLGNLPLAVVLYHRVDDAICGEPEGLTVTRRTFERHLRMYRDHFQVISVTGMLDLLERGVGLEEWTVVITFDDGYRDNVLHAAPLLRKYGLPACFFLTAGYLETGHQFEWDARDGVRTVLMNWAEARDLAAGGFEIGAHSLRHADLGRASLDEARQEARRSKEILESRLGREIEYFSYPFGRREHAGETARQAVAEAGYRCAFTAFGGYVRPGLDRLALPRIPVSPYFRDEDSLRMELEACFRWRSYFRPDPTEKEGG